MTQESKVNNNFILKAPDGGWGYFICVAVTINLVTTLSFLGAFGMIFNDFLIEIEMDSTGLTFMNGVCAMFVAFSGYLTNSLMKIASLRKLAFAGCLILNVGVFWLVFVHTKILFVFVMILQSIGFGLMYNVSCTILNDYFVERRLFAISLTQTIAAVFTMVAPQLVKWWSDMYGYRGVLIMISGFSIQSFIATALMQPVEWHMKKLPLNMTEETKILLVEKTDDAENCKTPTALSPKQQDLQKTEDNLQAKDERKGIKTIILEVIDVPLLKSYILTSAALGLTISVFIEFIFTLMLPQALYSMQWSEDKVSWAISLYMFGDLLTRLLLVILNKMLTKIGSNEIYIFGLVIALVTRLGMLWSENVKAMLIFITIMGISRCTITVLPPLIIAEAVGPDKFTSAIGIFMVLGGLANLILGPAIGAIRDLSDSYATAFYVLTSCFGAVIMFWIIELCYKRNAHKHMPKNNKKSTRVIGK